MGRGFRHATATPTTITAPRPGRTSTTSTGLRGWSVFSGSQDLRARGRRRAVDSRPPVAGRSTRARRGVHERHQALRRAPGRGSGDRRPIAPVVVLPYPSCRFPRDVALGEWPDHHGTVVSSPRPLPCPQATPTPSGAPSVAISSCFTSRKIHTITLAVQIMNAPVRNAWAAPAVKPAEAGSPRDGARVAAARASWCRAGTSWSVFAWRSAPPRSTGSRDRARRRPAAWCSARPTRRRSRGGRRRARRPASSARRSAPMPRDISTMNGKMSVQ